LAGKPEAFRTAGGEAAARADGIAAPVLVRPTTLTLTEHGCGALKADCRKQAAATAGDRWLRVSSAD